MVRVVEELLADCLVNCRLVPSRKLGYNPRLAKVDVLDVSRQGMRNSNDSCKCHDEPSFIMHVSANVKKLLYLS